MTLTNNDLLALSNLLDTKLKSELEPIKTELKYIRVNLIENNILPRLSTIEACYTSTSHEFGKRLLQIDAIQQDISVLKQVVSEHSIQFQEIS